MFALGMIAAQGSLFSRRSVSPFAKPDSRSASVFVDELDAGGLKSAPYR
jgi:hypothetical protein